MERTDLDLGHSSFVELFASFQSFSNSNEKDNYTKRNLITHVLSIYKQVTIFFL